MSEKSGQTQLLEIMEANMKTIEAVFAKPAHIELSATTLVVRD